MKKRLFGTFKKIQKWVKIKTPLIPMEEEERDPQDVYEEMKSKGVFLHFYNDSEKEDSDSNS